MNSLPFFAVYNIGDFCAEVGKLGFRISTTVSRVRLSLGVRQCFFKNKQRPLRMSATRIETTYLKLIFTKLACSTKKVAGAPYQCVPSQKHGSSQGHG